MDKLVLFDIDRTLLEVTPWHKKSFSKAFKDVYGIDATIDVIEHQGMSDQKIIIEALKKHGLKEQEIMPKLTECMKNMEEFFIENLDSNNVVPLDGVTELLEELKKRNVLMGIVTGNLQPIAEGKLRKTGLYSYFKVAGFGSEDTEKSNLVRLAISRARERFDLEEDGGVFLFGDASIDIISGREAGVKAIGVATGLHSKGSLKYAGADAVLDNLKDTKEVLELIFGK